MRKLVPDPIFPLPVVGDTVFCEGLRRVVDVDPYGFCKLSDKEGETIIRHYRDWPLSDDFMRLCGALLADKFDEQSG